MRDKIKLRVARVLILVLLVAAVALPSWWKLIPLAVVALFFSGAPIERFLARRGL